MNNSDTLKATYTNPKHNYSIAQLNKVIQLLKRNHKASNSHHISGIEERIKSLQMQSPVKQPFIYQITSSLQRNNDNSNIPINNSQLISSSNSHNKPIEQNMKYIQSIFNTQSTDMSYTPAKKKCKRSYVMMNQENKEYNANSNSNNDNNSDCPISNTDLLLKNKSKKYKYM